MYLRCLAAGLVVFTGITQMAYADVAIDGYTAATNDRFTNSSSFIESGENLSGVGQSTNGRWGTLVSSNVIVSANHFAPSGNISFYANNDPSTAAVVRQVTNSVRIGDSDLWMAKLSAPVDNKIKAFDFATQHLNDNPGIYQGAEVLMTGRSPESHLAIQDQAFGQNVVSGMIGDVDFLGGKTDALVMNYDPSGSANAVKYETHLASGDSGAPMFIEENGRLLLAGVNSFVINGVGNQITGSGATYLGNYSQQLEHFISVSAVPEPSSLLLLAASAGAWRLHSRKRKMQTTR